jgi:hypothetical protein
MSLDRMLHQNAWTNPFPSQPFAKVRFPSAQGFADLVILSPPETGFWDMSGCPQKKEICLPSGYDWHRHGKIHHAIKNGKPSISIRAIDTMAMLVITRG